MANTQAKTRRPLGRPVNRGRTQARFVAPAPQQENAATPAGASPEAITRRLHALLYEKARPRLLFLAAALTCLAVFGFVVSWFFGMLPTVVAAIAVPVNRWVFIVDIVVGLAVIGTLLLRPAPGPHVLWLAFAYQLYVCGSIALHSTYIALLKSNTLPVVTWVEVMLVLFPMLVPTTPRLAIMATVGSALLRPLLAAVVVAGLDEETGVLGLLVAVISPALAGGLGLAASRVMYDFGRDAARAQLLGSYRLDRRLGQGGMGEVWTATHRYLARPAAVKFILPAGSDEQSRDALFRFEREAQATAQLVSPHTIRLFDFGQTEDDRFFYVMELLRGVDLMTYVRRFGAMPPARVIHVVSQVCRSLEEAHGQGLVHRDIKPSNLMLCHHGTQYDFVKVLDFGLVKPMTNAPSPLQTLVGSVVGTPAFISPEGARADPVDHRSDIYALGLVLYFLLTGRVLFGEEKTPQGMLLAHASREPMDFVWIGKRLPEGLEDLVLRCLAKAPDARPQSARELRHLLEAIASNAPWDEAQAQAWWEEHRPIPESQVVAGDEAGDGAKDSA